MNKANTPHIYFKEASKHRFGCYFCDPFEGSIVHKSENFVVLLDTFPIKQGHLMISSKKHYGCAGEIPSELMSELLCIKDTLRNHVEKFERNVIFYEHGRAGCCLESNPNGNECSHFHLHCLPANISLTHDLEEVFDSHLLDDYSKIKGLFCEEGPYLYFEDSKGKMNFFPATDKEVAPHLLRTMICDRIGIPERSNWEDCYDAEPYVLNYTWAKEKMSSIYAF